MALIVLGGAAAWLWRRRSIATRGGRPEKEPFPALRRSLRQSDRLAGRLGFSRQEHETLSAFAERLRRETTGQATTRLALADWYDDYVRVRYGTQDAAGHADRLSARLREFTARQRSG
jgi:hypothetical protein